MSRETSERKQILKELAAEHSMKWRLAALMPTVDGLARIETKHQSIYFQDGVCVRAGSRRGDTQAPCQLHGMRLVGWLDDRNRLLANYAPGARAILWRASDDDMTIALTGRTQHFEMLSPYSGHSAPTKLSPIRPAFAC